MATSRLFRDRVDAGRQLGTVLLGYRSSSPLVLALPRGGVPVAFEVARALRAPLDVWVARKIGAPVQPELAMGAVAEGGEVHLDASTVDAVGVSEAEVEALVEEKSAEVEERAERFRGGRPPPDVRGRTVILVDDGIATGCTARAALRSLRHRGAGKLVLAAPIAAEETAESLRREADEIVCLAPVSHLFAIGLWYDDFTQTTDDDVLTLLARARGDSAGLVQRDDGVHEVLVQAGDAISLAADLGLPRHATGLVLFAHGSGSSRKSPRNRRVAERLRRAGLATLLVDLLTEEEEEADELGASFRFDIDLLARRLVAATDWARAEADLRGLPLGYFGASTGAAAALVAAAERPGVISAVVSRGGRPDLATNALTRVRAPTLLIVGGRDLEVLRLNQAAFDVLDAPKRLEIVPGATHLFEERGALERVADLASDWLVRHLIAPQWLSAGASPSA